MRQKAEKKIRRAVIEVGSKDMHRLDKVRVKAGLHPKVYDKTILDMARVGTIALSTEGIESLSSAEISKLVHRGEIAFVSFCFIDGTEFPEASAEAEKKMPEPIMEIPPPPEPVILILDGLSHEEWQDFSVFCKARGMMPEKVVEGMMRAWLRQNDN